MEFLIVLILGFSVATSNVVLPKSKDSNQLEEIKVVQTKEKEASIVKTNQEELIKKPELVKEEVKSEPIQKEEVKPEPIQKEEVKPEPIQKEEANWLNIILYIIGAIAVIAAGMYFFKRKKITPPVSVADNIRPKFDEEIIPALSEQKPTQEETQEEKSPEDNSSDDNNKK